MHEIAPLLDDHASPDLVPKRPLCPGPNNLFFFVTQIYPSTRKYILEHIELRHNIVYPRVKVVRGLVFFER